MGTRWIGFALVLGLVMGSGCEPDDQDKQDKTEGQGQEKDGEDEPTPGAGLGETQERPAEPPPPLPPEDELSDTATGPGCRITADFSVELNRRTLNFSDLAPGFSADSTAVPSVRVTPRFDGIGLYPGTLTISATQDGRAIPFTREDGTTFSTTDPFTSTITLGELERAPLETELQRVDGELSTARAAYRFRAPAGLDAANPVAEETITATATWKPRDHPECTKTRSLKVRWVFGSGSVSRPPKDEKGKNRVHWQPQPEPYVHPGDGTEFVVVPLYHFWELDDPFECCGDEGEYEVIQFARVVYDDKGNNPPYRKGHDWALDIRESEKVRARAGQSYDPTFTNDPRGTNPGGSMVGPGPGGSSSIRQEDAPGMTKERYDELVAASKKVVVTWQFLAFLVCPPDVPRGANPATTYLASAKVCRAAVYELTWTFPARVGAPPNIKVEFKDVEPSGRSEPCTQNLADWFRENGVEGNPYERPVAARSQDLTEDQHDDLLDGVNRFRLKKP